MPTGCGTVHGVNGAPFVSMLVQPLDHGQMPVAGSPVHCLCRAPFRSMPMQPHHHVQVSVGSSAVHRIHRTPLVAVRVQPCHRIHSAMVRRTVHDRSRPSDRPSLVQERQHLDIVSASDRDRPAPHVRQSDGAPVVDDPPQESHVARVDGVVHQIRRRQRRLGDEVRPHVRLGHAPQTEMPVRALLAQRHERGGIGRAQQSSHPPVHDLAGNERQLHAVQQRHVDGPAGGGDCRGWPTSKQTQSACERVRDRRGRAVHWDKERRQHRQVARPVEPQSVVPHGCRCGHDGSKRIADGRGCASRAHHRCLRVAVNRCTAGETTVQTASVAEIRREGAGVVHNHPLQLYREQVP
ncbi:hypothetical protein BC831DRAFT_459201 [Entophlyctis helioformis]|nr:hypothetical protein BC831DRAFT_459201 [Entophlyctis helioformis]